MNTIAARLALLGAAIAAAASAQQDQLAADFAIERKAIADSCAFSLKGIGSCAYTLFTDHPLHIAAGSIAPQNGFGLGPAFVAHWQPVVQPSAPSYWRLSWDVDGLVSTNQSWRAGAYMTAVWVRRHRLVARPGGGALSNLGVPEYPVFHVVAQGVSLNTIPYFGLGPNTSDTARSYFGMRQSIVGVNVAWPILQSWHIALYGEANGRFVDIRPSAGRTSPSIEQLYTPATAPGLARQPAFAQFGQGIRMTQEFAGGRIRLNYAVTFKEYAAGDSTYSFQRLTTDLSHEFPIYRNSPGAATSALKGPDDCSTSIGDAKCPPPVVPPGTTRNRWGSVTGRFLLNRSFTQSGHVVPFYFQPTLGGSDIDNNPELPSYQDYRFRAPNNILAEARFEHVIYGPIGFTALIDEGKVALRGGDLDFTHLRHSYAAGLTLRAGGFPMVWLLFSWGGREGTHTIGAMNTSLLGASPRPSLY
jgi:hypothetical protein